MNGDIMTSVTSLSISEIWSGINNALLEDSGWYKVSGRFREVNLWGKG